MNPTLARAVAALHSTFAVFHLLAVGGKVVAAGADEWLLRPGSAIGVLELVRKDEAKPLSDTQLKRRLGRAASLLRKQGLDKDSVYNFGDRVEIVIGA